jgi:hypothetical protein
MRRIFATALIVAATSALAVSPVRAAAPANDPATTFSDALCPATTEPVRKYYALGADPNTTVDDFLAQIKKVIDAYELCRSEKISNGSTRESQWAETRLAQFHYSAGHMQRLTDQTADAKKSLDTALDLANDVANWTPPTQSFYRSNNVNVGSGSSHNATSDRSVYYDSAVSIRDAITKELALLANPAPSASAAPNTAPAPTHT